jgi:hypothetical protein
MSTLICPRCFSVIPHDPELKFCPRCGLPNAELAGSDTRPIELRHNNRTYRVTDRLAIGSFATLYLCDLPVNSGTAVGVVKIARDARSNAALQNEARILRELFTAADIALSQPFLPRLVDSFPYSAASAEAARQANVLAYHAEIDLPDDLYSLHEVRAAYPAGLDARDVAWIWRRLLSVLSFCHANALFHSAVLPEHVLIEPKAHKLVLIDWCFATSTKSRATLSASTAALRHWFERDGVARPSSPALDISLAARSMVFLLAGDPILREYPSGVDVAVRRHFDRCIDLPNQSPVSARQLLAEFDKLIEALWGPRQFRILTLPPRR